MKATRGSMSRCRDSTSSAFSGDSKTPGWVSWQTSENKSTLRLGRKECWAQKRWRVSEMMRNPSSSKLWVHHSKCVTPVQTSLHRRSILHLKNTETFSKVSRRLTKNSQQQFSWSQSWWNNNNDSLIWRASAPLVVLFPLRKLPHPLTVNITSAGSGP